MELFAASLHYYCDAPTAQTLVYPMFDTDAGSLTISVTVGSLRPGNTARSTCRLPSTVIPSYFRTRFGHPITLQPQSDACLIFTGAPGEE